MKTTISSGVIRCSIIIVVYVTSSDLVTDVIISAQVQHSFDVLNDRDGASKL